MKKLFTLGLLILGVCASAGANVNSSKSVKKDKVDCMGGITSCGTTYNICDANGIDESLGLAVWDLVDAIDCAD